MNEEDLMKYTKLAMQGLTMSDEEIQSYKVIADAYLIMFNEFCDKQDDVKQAMLLATNAMAAMIKGNADG